MKNTRQIIAGQSTSASLSIRILAVAISVIFVAGSMQAATNYVWTGGTGVGSTWYDAGNWADGVPSEGTSKIASPIATAADDVAIFDSETATGGYMPTDNMELVRVSASFYPPNVEVRNGTVIFNRADNYGYGSTFTVGDGDLTTPATFNMAATINMNRDGSSVKTYVVNADGTLLMGQSFDWVTAGRTAVIQLLGGAVIVNGSITGDLTNDPDNYVFFEAAGSTFSAAFGGQLTDLATVEANIGTTLSFRAAEGITLGAKDNGDSTFTVYIPPPAGTVFYIK